MEAPPEGSKAARADEKAGGAHLLYFPYTVNTNGQQLSFRYQVKFYISGIDWVTPATFSTGQTNQQALAYVSTTVPSLSDYPTDACVQAGECAILFRPAPGDPLTIPASGWGTYTGSLDAWVGKTVYITFAEAVYLSSINFGVDDIQVTCTA